MPVCLLCGVCYRLRHRGGVPGSVCDLGQGCAAAAVNLSRRAYNNVLWYGDESVGFAASHTMGGLIKVGGGTLIVIHLFMVFPDPVAVVGHVLRCLGCDEERIGRMAHRPGNRYDPPFTDSCGPSGWWLVVFCPQQYMTTYNVIYKGEGFRAFLKVGEGDARG